MRAAVVVRVIVLCLLGLKVAGLSVGRCLTKVPTENGRLMPKPLCNASIFARSQAHGGMGRGKKKAASSTGKKKLGIFHRGFL